MPPIDQQKINQQIAEAMDEAGENLRQQAIKSLHDFSISAELRQKLEASLKIEKSPDGQSLFLTTDLQEAADLEFGLLRQTPQPWLSGALRNVIPDLKQRVRVILQNAGRG